MVETRVLELPEGPVTLMFTDIEGSTALRTTLGDAETDRLFRQHDELVQAQVAEHNGYDQHAALGDGFLVVFLSTKRALTCAIAIQRALDAFNRQRGGPPLRIRIGLNTGEVTETAGQISGEAVHAAARVCAVADGGQVLISDITRQLAGTMPDVSFRDTGEYELKGFPTPWRLWDVLWVRESTGPKAPVFVARTEQLNLLNRRLGDALDGHGGLVLVGGEPGVGKTALVRQLITEAERRGALSVFGRCYESEGAVAYSPFVEMLEQALSLMPPDIVREDMGDDAPEIARMVPELRRRFPDIPHALDLPPEQQRRYFFNAVASFVARGAQRFPLVMVLDDIHWADESTLLLMEHIAALIPEHRILGIATYRDIELDVSRPLAASLERMLRAHVVERVQVARFGLDDVGRMIAALAGRDAPSAVVAAVFAETEGNPFFVGEVFRHFVEEGKLFDEHGEFRADLDVDELDVPESVRLVVGRRLERLGPQAQKALAAAAVIGRAFPFRLLEEVSDTSGGALIDIVDDAERAQVLVSEERDGEVVFSFAHELIRQTLLAGLSVLRRQRLHLAVADAIERLVPNAILDRPQELADHLLRAGAAADPKRLVNALTGAADRAIGGAAFESALRSIEDALAIVDPDAHEQCAYLLELRGTALRALGRLSECVTAWRAAAENYVAAENRRAAGLVNWQMGVSQMWLGDFADAFVSMHAGVEALGDHNLPERLLVGGGIGALLGFAGLHDDATRAFADAQATAGDVTDPRYLGVIRWSESLTGWNFGMLEDCVRAGREAVAHLRATTDAWTLADAMAWLAFGLVWKGELVEGRAIAAEGAQLAARVGHIGTHSLCSRNVAWADYLTTADSESYLEAARADLPVMESIDSPWVALTHGWLSDAYAVRGETESALHHARETIRLMPQSAWTGFGEATEVIALSVAGERDACYARLEHPMFETLPPHGAYPAGRQFCYHALLTAVVTFDDAERAGALYPDAARLGERYHHVWFQFFNSQRVAGAVAVVAGLYDEAERHLHAASDQVLDDPNPLDAPHLDYWWARLYLGRGDARDRPRAQRHAVAARDEFARRPAPFYLARAAELVARVMD